MKRLIAFDMDSTLIQCEVIDEIARKNGRYQDVSKITELAMNGQYNFTESLLKRVALLKGVKEHSLIEIREDLPYTNGLESLINYLKDNSFIIAILSGGFDIFANKIFSKFNLDYQFSNQLELRNGKLTGNVIGEIIDKEKKAAYLKMIASKESISLEQTIAVGDGANDLLMLNAARIGIAFNAKASVKKQAKFFLDSNNIAEIIPIIEKELAI